MAFRQGVAWLAAAALAAPAVHADAGLSDDALDRLLALSLEELDEVKVTTASPRAERLSDAPASVFVIHRDDIRRLGIHSLPEALRLAPNLQVARINASSHAVTARGLKTDLGNKLLVMIDGRPIYTPLFAGVLWDMQRVPMGEIDRIEVVSGPGAAAWGANAVNGVINIVTRPATEAVGGYASGWLEEGERGLSVGQAFALRDGAVRAYARHVDIDDGRSTAGTTLPDGWEQQQAGFRADWEPETGEFTLQGDVMRGESSPRAFGPIEVSGYNLLASWTRRTGADSHWDVRGYVDVVERFDPQVIDDRMTIAAIETTHESVHGAHRLTWGAGYRHGRDESRPGALARLVPADATLEWAHVFVSDQVALGPRVTLDLDLRLDSNPYTGIEVLPSARLAWRPASGGLLWGAASRTVRSPSRFDRAFHFPATDPPIIRGGPDFESEVAEVLEIGWRDRPTDWLAWSVTGFHHRFSGLRGGEPGPEGGIVIANRVEGRLYGVEGWATVRLPERWELAAGFIELRKDLRVQPGFPDPGAIRDQGDDPEHQWLLRATTRLGEHQQLAAFARHVSALPDPHVPAYVQVDARWSWTPTPRTELGIGVRNLFDDRHTEQPPSGGLTPSEFGRTAFVDLRLGW